MAELRFTFQPRKTAQAAAFLLKLSGGSHTKGHIVKMLYATDRRQIRTSGLPMTGDAPFSMKDGPILSAVLDLLDGDTSNAYWAKHISTATKDSYQIKLLKDPGEELLTDSEKESLTKAHAFFDKMSWPQVRAFCHNKKNFAEWEDPGRSRKPILLEKIYQEVGRSKAVIEEIQSLQREEALFARLLA